MNVLITDDDAVTRTLLRSMLIPRGHRILETADGLSAWQCLCEHNGIPGNEPIQFVISDWMMPGLDGPNLVARIRAASFPHYTYIVMLTARDGVHDTVIGLEAGADDYLTKPFDMSELRARFAIGERILNLETQLREANRQLENMATHDSLTGLLNRRAVYDQAGRELVRALREELPLSVILIDLDHFKGINDDYGHLAGDLALRQAASILQGGLREYDLLGRWGGEEFLMVLPGTDGPGSLMVAERLRNEISHSPLMLAQGQLISVHASFGVTALTGGHVESDLDELVRGADIALYQAKQAGRNQVFVYAP